MSARPLSAAIIVVASTILACSSSTEPEPTPIDSKNQLLPIANGNRWRYTSTSISGLSGFVDLAPGELTEQRTDYLYQANGVTKASDERLIFSTNSGDQFLYTTTSTGIIIGRVDNPPAGRIIEYRSIPRFPQSGDVFEMSGGDTLIWGEPTHVETPAGSFDDCYTLSGRRDHYYCTLYFKRGIGVVRLVKKLASMVPSAPADTVSLTEYTIL